MAEAVAEKESHVYVIDINQSENELPPAVNGADSPLSREEKKQRLLDFAKELGERKEKQISDLRSEVDQTTNALLQISGIYFAFVGLLLSIVAGGSNITCKHLWSPIALCTLGSIGFWIALFYLVVFVFYEKEDNRQKLVRDIKDIEVHKIKISKPNSLDTLLQKDIREEAIRIGLLPRPPLNHHKLAGSPNNRGQVGGAGKRNWSARVNELDAKARGLFFFVFFLGGFALVATYFTVTFSIVHILCH